MGSDGVWIPKQGFWVVVDNGDDVPGIVPLWDTLTHPREAPGSPARLRRD